MPVGSTDMGSNMNCKPGDMAIIVKTRHTEHLGKIVQVHEFHASCGGWTHSPSLPIGEQRFQSLWIEDACLRPLRGDPQPDAVDTARPKEVTA